MVGGRGREGGGRGGEARRIARAGSWIGGGAVAGVAAPPPKRAEVGTPLGDRSGDVVAVGGKRCRSTTNFHPSLFELCL